MRVRPCGREERGANFLRLKELERMGLAIQPFPLFLFLFLYSRLSGHGLSVVCTKKLSTRSISVSFRVLVVTRKKQNNDSCNFF